MKDKNSPLNGLLIHAGMPKTGSTALQLFMKKNRRTLWGKNLNYVRHGLGFMSHNKLASQLRSKAASVVWDNIAAEVEAHPGALSIISSEALSAPVFADAMARHMPAALRAKTRIIIYLRRQDAALEARYKQLIKKGRVNVTPEEFVAQRSEELCDYAAMLEHFAEALGVERILLRRFERSALTGGDVVADFLNQCGLDKGDPAFVQPAHEANQTLSRAATEQLGALARRSRLNVRALINEMPNDPQGMPKRSGDVFTLPQRREIMARFEAGNAQVAWRFLKDGSGTLFDTADLGEGAPERYPDPKEEIALYAEARERIAAAIGRIEQRGRDKLFRG